MDSSKLEHSATNRLIFSGLLEDCLKWLGHSKVLVLCVQCICGLQALTRHLGIRDVNFKAIDFYHLKRFLCVITELLRLDLLLYKLDNGVD